MDFCTDETKLKISKIHIGRICSKETKDKMSKSRQGKTQSEETRNKISNSSKGKIKSDEYKLKLSKARKGISTKKSKPIIQYDLEGKLIREWDKIDHALKFLGKPINDSSLTQCCKGINKTAHGYKWKYK